MGGDQAPAVPIRGAVEALHRLENELTVLVVGDPAAIRRELSAHRVDPSRFEVVPASEAIEMSEPPVEAVRAKPDSSIVRGVRLQASGEADAFISAGPTGAVLAASMLFLEPLPGIDRPAIAAPLPTLASRPTLVVDVGANVDCKPRQLEQFAYIGHAYARMQRGVSQPRVALLNVGVEAGKGNAVVREAHEILGGSPLKFVGSVEGRDVILGDCDVIVCDGFVGNVILKFFESLAGRIAQLVSQAVAGGEMEVDLQAICRILDYAEYGGAPLLGIDGVTIICHGDSPTRAIRRALGVAIKSVESDMVGHLRGELSTLAGAPD